MNKRFDEILDECVNLINCGEKLEDCLARFPEHAAELEPFLRTVVDTKAPLKFTPSSQAKSVAKQRFDSAIEQSQRRQDMKYPLFNKKPRWAAAFAAVAAVVLVALISYFTINPALAPGGPGDEAVAQANFRLLISDEVNAIADFASCNATVSKIGLQQDGESGNWTYYDIDPITVDLTNLVGKNATEIWSGYVTPGNYTKVFIYVDYVEGILNDGNETNVQLPSNKLHISKPFTISEEDGDLVVNFVFDVTVHKAGKSGMYILHPQLSESGPDIEFVDVTPRAQGKPEWAGPPEGVGPPENAGPPEWVEPLEGNGTPEWVEPPVGNGTPEWVEPPVGNGTPEWVEPPVGNGTPEWVEPPVGNGTPEWVEPPVGNGTPEWVEPPVGNGTPEWVEPPVGNGTPEWVEPPEGEGPPEGTGQP